MVMIGHVYKIVNNINSDIYIGSTKHTLQHRLGQHQANAKCQTTPAYNCKFYQFVREVGRDNIYIEPIEVVEYNDILELRHKEKFYIKSLQPALNMRMYAPSKAKERMRAYQQTDACKEYRKAYQQTDQYKAYHANRKATIIDCECGAVLNITSKYRHIQTVKHIKRMAVIHNTI